MKSYLEDLRDWVWPVLSQHCKHDGNWSLNRRKRLAYTIKTLVCLVLHRDNRKAPKEPWPDEIEVAMANYRHFYGPESEGADWDYIGVGYGWRRWYYAVRSTGYP